MEKQFDHETKSHPIYTGFIFENEYNFWINPDESAWPKYPNSIADVLIVIIKNLLVKYSEPSMEHSESTKEYLKDKKDAIYREPMILNTSPFVPDYFVLGLDKPIEKYSPPRVFLGGEFYYLYELKDPVAITKKMATNYQFELLFAFYLRQCNLTELDDLLNYQLEQNFDSDLKEFIKYLVLLRRKFENILFSKGLTEAITEWISINEKNISKKKIKTHLTVDQLAFLFKALVENKLLSDDNKNDIINMVCENFEAKKQPHISVKSFNGKFYTPTEDAIKFWVDQFDKLNKLSIREEQKLSL
jgi:hypothetical protein